jgi:hypothetical protein
MDYGEKTIKNVVTLLKGEGFKVKSYTEYGRYFVEFDSTGLTSTSLRKVIECVPSKSVFTSNPRNRCFIVDTGIKK